jgi:hypothetical protein
MVALHMDPVPYDHVHTVDGRRFRVTVKGYAGDEIDVRLSKYAGKLGLYGERDQLD